MSKLTGSAAELKRTLIDHLARCFLPEENELFEFDVEDAIFWFACHYHTGQDSDLYAIMSTSPFTPGIISRGPEPHSLAAEMYGELCRTFGGDTPC